MIAGARQWYVKELHGNEYRHINIDRGWLTSTVVAGDFETRLTAYDHQGELRPAVCDGSVAYIGAAEANVISTWKLLRQGASPPK